MRIAVFSDIHANLAALESVLEAIDAETPDALWCLGDLIGYGPKPNECTAVVRERADVCLCGNHDLGIIGSIDLSEFSGDAGFAARWTMDVLEPESRAFIETLEPTGRADGVALYHGSARDPVWEYVLSGDAAYATLRLTQEQIVLVGHSHVALEVRLHELLVEGGLAAAGTQLDLTDARWVMNPGSVGQPRDGDPRAAWMLLDLDAQRAEFRRVDYDIERTQAEMRAVGLPEPLVSRLAAGQ
jgi:predicted phosphodiesterase